MRVAVVLVLSVVVAGCLRASDEQPGPTPAPGATTLVWGMTGCDVAIGVVRVEADRFQDRVPEGFRLQTPSEALAPPGVTGPAAPDGDALVIIEMFRCAEEARGSGPAADRPTGGLAAFVEPPPELRVDGVKAHFLRWDVLVTDPERRTTLADAGAAARDGDATFSRFDATGDVVLFEGSLVLAPGEEYAFSGTAPGPGEAFKDYPFVEYAVTPDGLVTWVGRAAWSQLGLGSGTITIPDGSWLRETVETDSVDAGFFAGVLDMVDAEIRIGPRPPAPEP